MGNVEPTFMLATVCSLIMAVAQMFTSKGSRRKITPADFIPEWSAEPKEDDDGELTGQPKAAETIEEMKKLFQELAKANPQPKKRRKPK